MLIYRILLSILFLPILFMLILRSLRGEESWTHLKQRFGLDFVEIKDEKPVLWFHAASNGELKSAVPVIEKLVKSYSGITLLITSNTVSATHLAKDLGFKAQLAPLDYRWALKRFCIKHQVTRHILMESEIWPNRIKFLHYRKSPILILGGRISAASARSWSWLKPLADTTFNKISFLSAQDKSSLDRFKKLGLNAASIGPLLNLKSLFRASRPSQSRDTRANLCVAVSTHLGEEEILLDAFLIAKKTWPNLRMIIAPRHPKRSKQIGLLIASRDLNFVTRSSGKPFVREHHDILLADSLGEMDLWYAQCGICIIGGTFGKYGGHTPYEPSAYGCAILHGAHVDNFRHEFNQLTKSKATVACAEARELATTLLAMKSTSVQEIQADMVKNALGAVTDFEQLMDDVLDILTTDS